MVQGGPSTTRGPSVPPLQPAARHEEKMPQPASSLSDDTPSPSTSSSTHPPTSTDMSAASSSSSSSSSNVGSSGEPSATPSSHQRSPSTAFTASSPVAEPSISSSSNCTPVSESKPKFASSVRRGGWRNVASVASSRDHSDASSGEDDKGPSSRSRIKRPSQRRINSVGVAGPSAAKTTPSRLSGLARTQAATARRQANKSLADTDSDDDQTLDASAVDDSEIHDEDGGGVWQQLSDQLPVMTPPGSVVQLPSAIPTAPSTSSVAPWAQGSSEIDWANFVHAYARGRWDPSKPLMPPGRSSAFPGAVTKIIVAASGDAFSDGGLTCSDTGSECDGRRPSLTYEPPEGGEEPPHAPQSTSSASTPGKALTPTPSIEAVLNGAHHMEGLTSRTGRHGDLHRSASGSRHKHPGEGNAASGAKIVHDLRVLQFSTASSPELSAADHVTSAADKEDVANVAPTAERMQRASKSLTANDSPFSIAARNEPPLGVDESVWRRPDLPPSPRSLAPSSDGFFVQQRASAQEADTPTPHGNGAPATADISANAAIAFMEAQKRATGEGPHRPGPTPVQLSETLDLAARDGVQYSAPAGLPLGSPGSENGLQKRQSLERSGSDPVASLRSTVSNSVDALRQAARRSKVKRSEDEVDDAFQPTTIHSQPRSRSDLQQQLLDATTPPGSHHQPLLPTIGDADTAVDAVRGTEIPSTLSSSTVEIPQRPANADAYLEDVPVSNSAPQGVSVRPSIPTAPDTNAAEIVAARYSQLLAEATDYRSNGKHAETFYTSCGYLPAISPPNEIERRKALQRYGPPKINGDPNFDRLAHLVRLVFDCEIVLISVVGSKQQVFQSAVGGGGDLSAETLQRIAGAKECSFCAHAILQTSDEPLVVLDAQQDWRFMGNPLVLGRPHIRFYAGSPLRTPDGFNLGSLCLISTQPRSDFSPRRRHTLKEFGRVVMREFELTRDGIHLKTRDRMQRSIEHFTRDCLEMEIEGGETDGKGGQDEKPRSGIGNLYNLASKAMHETLQAAGAVVFDLSHFELIESPSGTSGSKSSKIFFPSPFSAPDVTPYANFDNPSAIETITSMPGPPDESIKSQAVAPMSVLGASESSPVPAERSQPVPLTHHIRVAEFLRKHRTGHFYASMPGVFKSLLPADASSVLLVPVFGINKQPFALLCAYSKARQDGPMLDDVKDTALQYMRSMGTIILSAVLKKDIMLADQAKSHFISNISHELRTPLHGILASAELLAETKLNATQGSYLETVEACGKSLLELVNHVLDFTKLSGSSRSKSTPAHSLTPTDLVRLVQEVCESSWIGQMARKLESQQSAGIGSAYAIGSSDGDATHTASQVKQMRTGDVETVIDVSMRGDGWLVSCDAGGVRRCMMNLIGNALKFTSAGFVHIAMREIQSTPTHVVVELSVTDTGRGIGKPFLEEQLFHPFTQENQLGPGTGLGLSIVNSIVQSPSINGKIDVWSTVGEGTEMRITCEMPLVQPDEIDGPVYRPSLNLEQKRVVSLVGFQGNRGQLDLKQVLRSYFEGWWKFAQCKDGDDAYTGDIIVINEDINLLETVKEHRKVLPPVILLTGARGDNEAADACRAYHDAGGIARMLFKPAGPAKLEAVVDFCLQCLDRIDHGEPPNVKQTSPNTPLPSPKPSPVATRDDEKDGYFAPRRGSSLADEDSVDSSGDDEQTPMNLGEQTPIAARVPSDSGAASSIRPPLAHLRGDSHHISPGPLNAAASGILIRRHSAEDEASKRSRQKNKLSLGGRSPAAPADSPTNKKHGLKRAYPARPLLPARSITFHTEPRLNKQVALSPSAVSRQTEHPHDDYFSSKKVERRDEGPPPGRGGASPGSLVPIEGSGDGHVLRSAVGTMRDPKPNGKRLRVLGVDDNEINIKVLSAFLNKLDVEFVPAGGGEACLHLFDTAGPFDVVIVDITMPVLDGFQVTAAIRRKESEPPTQSSQQSTSKANPRAKVLCLTGRNSEEDKRRAFAAGADGFITRPLSLRSLSSILKLLTTS